MSVQQPRVANRSWDPGVDRTLFESALACPDEGDLVGIDHVVGAVLQDESDPRDLVTAQRPLLAGVPEALRGDKRRVEPRRVTSHTQHGGAVVRQTFSTAGMNCLGTLVPMVWSSNSSLVKCSGSRGSRTPVTLPYCPDPPDCFL